MKPLRTAAYTSLASPAAKEGTTVMSKRKHALMSEILKRFSRVTGGRDELNEVRHGSQTNLVQTP